MRMRTRLALALTLAPALVWAQQPQDVQLKSGGATSLWGAQYSAGVVNQFNTASPSSATDSFRWYQGIYSDKVPLLDLAPGGSIFGAATGGRQGAGTINAQGLFVNGVTTISGAGGTNGQIQYNNSGALGGFTTSGDATINTASGALTLATVNANVGSFGSATNCVSFTTNAKGLITAASAATCTPAIASITGLGTGVVTALGVNTGSAGAFVVNGGALGTPSSGTLTNATGLPIATGVSGLGSGVATWLATPSSANLATAVTGETGSGALVFGTSPTITTPSGIVKGDVGLGNVANLLQLVSVTKQVFTSSGTYTPTTGTAYAIIECVGGGAGGGGAAITAAVGQYSGGGGGAGGYSKVVVTSTTIGASQVVTRGAGGAGGSAGANNGTAGGDTSVGTLCVGKGGSPGLYANVSQFGAGGAGGVVGTGDLTAGGGSGGTGIYSTVSPSSVAYLTSGAGGASVFGAGGIAVQNGTGGGGSTNGQAAVGCGGGGSGGIVQRQSSGTETAAGGAGSNGCVFITEFLTQ